jgi:hypothetical protein
MALRENRDRDRISINHVKGYKSEEMTNSLEMKSCVLHEVGSGETSFKRRRLYKIMLAAAETFSDSTSAVVGIRTRSLAACISGAEQPFRSLPKAMKRRSALEDSSSIVVFAWGSVTAIVKFL